MASLNYFLSGAGRLPGFLSFLWRLSNLFSPTSLPIHISLHALASISSTYLSHINAKDMAHNFIHSAQSSGIQIVWDSSFKRQHGGERVKTSPTTTTNSALPWSKEKLNSMKISTWSQGAEESSLTGELAPLCRSRCIRHQTSFSHFFLSLADSATHRP